MAYEVFKRTGARVETPTLSIVPGGRIAINAAATRIVLEAGIKRVLLLWDQTNHRVAIKAAKRGDENAYAVSVAPGSHSGSLRAKAFLSYIGWKGRKREMIPTAWNEKERMFEATLPLEHLESERWGIKRPEGR
jgi:hypothetical protein